MLDDLFLVVITIGLIAIFINASIQDKYFTSFFLSFISWLTVILVFTYMFIVLGESSLTKLNSGISNLGSDTLETVIIVGLCLSFIGGHCICFSLYKLIYKLILFILKQRKGVVEISTNKEGAEQLKNVLAPTPFAEKLGRISVVIKYDSQEQRKEVKALIKECENAIEKKLKGEHI